MASEVSSIADFFTNSPLYTPFTGSLKTLPPQKEELYPAVVSKDCNGCGFRTLWDRDFTEPHYDKLNGFVHANYVCRNCKRNIFMVWFSYSCDVKERTITCTKHGQWPKLEVNPPPVLKKALSQHQLKTYRSGKTLRHHGYGVGALIYFRRLIEDTTNEMLDLLSQALTEAGVDQALVRQVEEAKRRRIFEDKVKLAADLLPAHLRPGGVNPFGLLYDLVSKGIHRLSDEECCAIVDQMDAALIFIYKELKANVEERKTYAETMKDLLKNAAPKKQETDVPEE